MSVQSSPTYTAPVPKMPSGLVLLMEGLAKEVLKCNPPDVYSFCADHMKKLIEIRNGPIFKRELTLEMKIAKATSKIRERAERRCKDYDLKIQAHTSIVSQNDLDKSNSDSELIRIKNKIVKIPEEILIGDVERELIVKIENSLPSESVKRKEINLVKIPEENLNDDVEQEIIVKTEISLPSDYVKDKEINLETDTTELQSVDINLLSEACHNTNDVNNQSAVNITKESNHEPFKELQGNVENKCKKEPTQIDMETLEQTKSGNNDLSSAGLQKTNEIISDVKAESQTIDKTGDEKMQYEIDENLEIQQTAEKHVTLPNYDVKYLKAGDENQNAIEDTLINTDNQHEYETSHNNDNDEQEKSEIELNEERVDTAINYSDTGKTIVSDETNLYISIEKGIENVTKGEDHIPLLLIPVALPHDNDSNIRDLQNHANNSMDLETAAITIQKVFRNFLFKNKSLSTDDATNVDINSLIEDKDEKGDNHVSVIINKDRRTLGLSRLDTVLQTVNEEKSLSQSTDDSSTLSSAATIIQAHVRGFLVRNKINLNKNSSTTSGVDSDGLSFTSMEGDNDNKKGKTILNIHIIPESGNFMSRDESVLTSVDLSLDGSPPCSTNLHPLSQDTSERRKQLKREDAFQSVSPPSNNSGKLSEDVDSVREILLHSENDKDEHSPQIETGKTVARVNDFNNFNISTMVENLDTALEVKSLGPIESPVKYMNDRPHSLPDMHSDEMDVITPFPPSEEKFSINSNLINSSEFHDVVLPTKVSRCDTSIVRGE